MTDPTIRERLRELAEKATPGPWKWSMEETGPVKDGLVPTITHLTGPRLQENIWDPLYIATVSPDLVLRLLDELDTLERRVRAAEDELESARRVCLMVGWSASDNTERGKAKHELWRAWLRLYEANGGSHEPRKHPELSDARIRELAEQRDAIVARTLAGFREPARSLISGTKEPTDG